MQAMIEMKGIGHFPMSENYPVFRRYLKQALEKVEARGQPRPAEYRDAETRAPGAHP